jgi:hypothetical protein
MNGTSQIVEKLKTDQVLFYTYNCQIYLCNYILKKKYCKMFKFSLFVTMTTLKLKHLIKCDTVTRGKWKKYHAVKIWMGPVKFHSKPVCVQVSVDKSK